MPGDSLPPEKFYGKHVVEMAEQRGEDGLRPRYRALRDYFLSHVPGHRILDLGCGHGRDVAYFVEQGYEAVGIDLAAAMVAYAQDQQQGTFYEMDMRDLAFDPDTFDGVWASASLFFLPPEDVPPVLAGVRRVLTDHGVLQANFKRGTGRYVKDRWGDAVVEYHFSDAEIREMVQSAGFEVRSRTRNQSPGGNEFLNYLCRPV
ncbi:MAG: class I SAM-dependent methyltransferase [Candidatus Nanohaloarchaea archaeon]|nr:class I SAM-dependent methyltransferase [Candidatus Nanohaloarchaea archaeon]